MNKKIWDAFRIVLGAYLVWIGIRILMETADGQPTNRVVLNVAAVLFIFIGAGYALFYVRKVSGVKIPALKIPSVKMPEFGKKKKHAAEEGIALHSVKKSGHGHKPSGHPSAMPSPDEMKLNVDENETEESELEDTLEIPANEIRQTAEKTAKSGQEQTEDGAAKPGQEQTEAGAVKPGQEDAVGDAAEPVQDEETEEAAQMEQKTASQRSAGADHTEIEKEEQPEQAEQEAKNVIVWHGGEEDHKEDAAEPQNDAGEDRTLAIEIIDSDDDSAEETEELERDYEER